MSEAALPGGGASLEKNEGTNTLTYESVSTQVRTLDQLLAICEVDLTVWRVDHYIENAWGVTMRGDDGEPVQATNFQVKAWLVRHKPISIMPTIQPVKVSSKALKYGRTSKRVMRDIEVAVVLPDPQIGFHRDLRTDSMTPFHDRTALDVALQITKAVQPDKVIWLGDLLDLPTFSSKFIQKPSFYWTTQSAIVEAHWWLSQFRRVSQAAAHYLLEGNHDKRLETAVLERFAAAYDLKSADALDRPPVLSIPGLLALDSIGVEYVGGYPDGRVWLNDKLVCEHGARVASGSGMSARKVVENSDINVIFGHVHRRERAGRTIHGRVDQWSIEAVCPGCLCRVTGEVPGQTKQQNWQQGMAVVHYSKNANIPAQIIPISIEDGRAIHEGVLYTGKDHTQQIARDTKWEALAK